MIVWYNRDLSFEATMKTWVACVCVDIPEIQNKFSSEDIC